MYHFLIVVKPMWQSLVDVLWTPQKNSVEKSSVVYLQGGPSGREPGLGWLAFWLFHSLPNSAWADGSLAVAAG